LNFSNENRAEVVRLDRYLIEPALSIRSSCPIHWISSNLEKNVDGHAADAAHADDALTDLPTDRAD
jgi:hypothetical protein